MSAPLILIVDDELHGLPAALEAKGFAVVYARTAHEALGLLAATRPSALLLDLMLPQGEGDPHPVVELGLGVLSRLRAGEIEGARRDLPVVVLSAACDRTVLRRIDALGVAARLEKPVLLGNIASALRAAAGSVVAP